MRAAAAEPGCASAPEPDTLVGAWAIQRRLVDRRAGVHATMAGHLALEPRAADIEWAETGVLRWLGQDIAVSRRYLIRDTVAGWWVLFPDGRPFHPWTPGAPVVHPCVEDVYRGLVTVDGPQRWRMLWDVTGPAKDQRIVTRFTALT